MSMKKFFYRVTDGDTVLLVSRNLGVPLTTLIKQNSLTSEIRAGDLLYVETENQPYIVKPFETFSHIAKKLGVSEQKLRDDNQVEYLFYGLSLKV